MIVTLWSPAAAGSQFVRAETAFGIEANKNISVMVETCDLPPPFNDIPIIDLRGWTGGSDDGEWDLLEAIAEKMGDRNIINAVLEQRYPEISGSDPQLPAARNTPAGRRVNSYDYTELVLACEELRDAVREFDPDILLTLDARSGLWAEMLFDWLQRRIPVAVGYHFEDVMVNGTIPIDGYLAAQAGKTSFLIPAFITELSRTGRILLVMDQSPDFRTEAAIRARLADPFGFSWENIGSLTLIATDKAKRAAAEHHQAYFRDESENARFLSLFYRDGLIPFSGAPKKPIRQIDAKAGLVSSMIAREPDGKSEITVSILHDSFTLPLAQEFIESFQVESPAEFRVSFSALDVSLPQPSDLIAAGDYAIIFWSKALPGYSLADQFSRLDI